MSNVLQRMGLRRRQGELAPLVEPLPPVVASPKQNELAEAVFSSLYRYILFGGAIRGGKTFGALMIFFILMKVFPRSRWAVVRKDLPTIRRNFLPTFEKLRPRSFCGPMNFTTWEATSTNGSKLIIMPESIREDPDLNRFKGLEVNGFLGEEVNELQEVTHYKMAERAGTWIIPDSQSSYEEEFLDGSGQPTGRKTGRILTKNVKAKQPAPINVYTCNPDMNWVYTLFYEPHERGKLKAPYLFIPALPSDNPHNPKGLIENLEEVLPEQSVERFIRGNWHVADQPDQLIKTEWIFNATNNIEPAPAGIPAMGVDVARYGADNTVFAYVYGNCLYRLEKFSQLSTTTVASFIRIRASEYPKMWPNGSLKPMNPTGASIVDELGRAIASQHALSGVTIIGTPATNCRVDGVGLGAGVVDDCIKAGFEVIEVIAGAKAVMPVEEKFRDKSSTGGRPGTGIKHSDGLPTRQHPKVKAFGSETREALIEAFPWRFKDLRSQMWWNLARELEQGTFCIDLDEESAPLLPHLIRDLTTPKYFIEKDKTITVETKEDMVKRLGRSTDYGDAVVEAAFKLPIVAKKRQLPPSMTVRTY